MITDARNTDGLRPRSSLDKLASAYPCGMSLEAMTETAWLLDEALDEADPNDGDIDAYLRQRKAPLN